MKLFLPKIQNPRLILTGLMLAACVAAPAAVAPTTGYADDGVPTYPLKRLQATTAKPVGTRNEPNLEAIAHLQPDLIIADLPAASRRLMGQS